MYTNYTYQDWENGNGTQLLLKIVRDYMCSTEFSQGLSAMRYFRGENDAIAAKTIVKAKTINTLEGGKKRRHLVHEDVAGNRVGNNFFFKAVTQQSQYLLANGVRLDDGIKEKLGLGFDAALLECSERALMCGVCWGFYNFDHVEVIPAVQDADSGFVALLDEMSSLPRVGIQFWRSRHDKPMYVRLFEQDGITLYKVEKDNLTIVQDKRAYVQTTVTDAAGTEITGSTNYTSLPVVPLFANTERKSELSPSIKAKIDCYDRIISDFADNLDRANDVYWVLNNFGGTTDDVLAMLDTINKVKAVITQSDGTGNASAQPQTIEVPYAARQTALEILSKQMHRDYMALDVATLTGGSLTNVAIKVAYSDMDLKANRFELQAFRFVQNLLKLIGVETEQISFVRQNIANDAETLANIYMMRSDIDQRTALKLNPYIMEEQIDGIMENKDAENQTGYNIDQLDSQRQMEDETEGEKDAEL